MWGRRAASSSSPLLGRGQSEGAAYRPAGAAAETLSPHPLGFAVGLSPGGERRDVRFCRRLGRVAVFYNTGRL
jgi:hypothetical protein